MRRTASLVIALVALAGVPAAAAELTLDSGTYLPIFQRESPSGEKLRYLPLFQELSGVVEGVGGTSALSLRFSGWGRVDLAEATGEDPAEGDLTSAYLQYVHPTGDLQARAGRFLLAEGTATGYLDGVFAKGVTPLGVGLAVYGGRPAETAGPGYRTGESLAGGRLFSRFQVGRAALGEVGVGFLTEGVPSPAPARKEMGGDLWLRVGGVATLSSEGIFDPDASAMAWDRSSLRLSPGKAWDIALATERYENGLYLSRTLNPALDSPTIGLADRLRVDSALLAWDPSPDLTLQGGVKRYRHRLADPGDALRTEGGARIRLDGGKGTLGVTIANVSGDLPEDGFGETRAFAVWSAGKKTRFSVEALARRYQVEIAGTKSAVQVGGSAGYQWSPALLLSGDLRFTQSPTFDKDLAAILRVRWNIPGGSP